ncbi:MAG: trypsin-like peptidase domain-containing protein [Gemmatimonadota bacterium]
MSHSLHSIRFAFACAVMLLVPPSTSAQETESPAPISLEELAERVTQAVVLIDVETASGSRQGSGFLIDPSGIILTNYHVIEDARVAQVKLASGDIYDQVSILAEDERRDIAVIRIAAFQMPTLPLGNSDSVRTGAPVVLVGSPLGLDNTVSTGIVSGRRQEPEGFQLLQITAPASPGSSGGAVLSDNGDVIGIAVSQMASGQNLNFAVPINYARGMLQSLGDTPVATLGPMTVSEEDSASRSIARATTVNQGLVFELDDLDYVVESSVDLGDEGVRRTRVSYRVIETVGGVPPRLERYMESETTRVTEPFGTQQTTRRERVRSLAGLDGLDPISSTGEVTWWTAEGWQTASHNVRFEGDRVVGAVRDSTGSAQELDETLPRGIIMRNMRDLAFAMLDADSLVGKSVEFVTFDPWTGETANDRYDILGEEKIDVAGSEREVLRVNVATGLINETVFFERQRPRITVRRVSQDGTRIEDSTNTTITGNVR